MISPIDQNAGEALASPASFKSILKSKLWLMPLWQEFQLNGVLGKEILSSTVLEAHAVRQQNTLLFFFSSFSCKNIRGFG